MVWMHYCIGCIMQVLLRASQRWPHPCHMSLTTPASEAWESITFLSKSISTRSRFAHTGISVKVAREGGCGFRNCCGGRLILTPDVPYLPLYLFLCFFLFFYFFLSFSLSRLPRSWSKESADTSAAARPPLSALFYSSFKGGRVGGGGGGCGGVVVGEQES